MDPAIKKQALRLFTYGLFIIMCEDDKQVNGFTANWLTQVSFEPPLVAVSVENASKSLPMIQHSGKFTINVLSSEQRELAAALGKSALRNPHKLDDIAYSVNNEGYPILQSGLGWVACELRQSVPAGDSTLILAEVVNAGILAEGQPLTMAAAGFRHAG